MKSAGSTRRLPAFGSLQMGHGMPAAPHLQASGCPDDLRKPSGYRHRSCRSSVPQRDQALLIFGADVELLDRQLFSAGLVWGVDA